MADKKISQLDLVAQINNDAVVPMSQESGGEQTTYKALITAIGEKIAEGMTFSNLATTAKNLVGAINELKASGAPIIIGTTAPSSGQGADGNIYIKYTEGTGGADDTVDSIYVKLDGTWCEAQTDYADLLNKPSVNGNTLSGNKTTSDLGIYGSNINMAANDSTKVKDRITALETNLTPKLASLTSAVSIGAGTIDTQVLEVNDSVYNIVTGFAITNTTNVVVMQCVFWEAGKITLRVRNLAGTADSYQAYIYYI